MKNWSVYIIHCSDGSYYTGITTDISRRYQEHAAGRGAKYFRGRLPVALVHTENGFDRSEASRREAEIKALTRQEKQQLVSASK